MSNIEYYLECLRNFLLRYTCAFMWLVLLCAFSYSDMLPFLLFEQDHSLSTEIAQQMEGTKMLITNVGLIGMVYVDNILVKLLSGPSKETSLQRMILIGSILLAILMSVFCEYVSKYGYVLRWEGLPVVAFSIFLVMLLIYKAESLVISYDNYKEF